MPFQPDHMSPETLRRLVKAQRRALTHVLGQTVPQHQAQEIVAQTLGHATWKEALLRVGRAPEFITARLLKDIQSFPSLDTSAQMRLRKTGQKRLGEAWNQGSAGGLTQMLVQLTPYSDHGSQAMWRGRMVSFTGGLMTALTHLRDQGVIRLDDRQIRRHMALEKMQALAQRTDLPFHVIETVQGYLQSLPRYAEKTKEGRLNEVTVQQHAYLEMQLSHVLNLLIDPFS